MLLLYLLLAKILVHKWKKPHLDSLSKTEKLLYYLVSQH